MEIINIPVTAYEQNCSLIICPATREAAVIDPGGDLPLILAQAKKANATISQILITHGHFDHCGGAKELADQLGVPILGPGLDDKFLLDSLPQWTAQIGFPHADPFVPDRWLADGDRLRVGEIAIETLHCPGHTPGHLVFFIPSAKLALVGDLLFAGSIGRTDFPRGNHQQLLDSIHDRLLPLRDDVEFVPGHGPNSTLGRERRSNPFLQDR